MFTTFIVWILVETSRDFNRVEETQELPMLLKSISLATFTAFIEQSYCKETLKVISHSNSDRDSLKEKLP